MKDTRLNIRVAEQFKRELMSKANELGISVTALVMIAIKEYLNK